MKEHIHFSKTLIFVIILGFVLPVKAQIKKGSNIHYLTDTTSSFDTLISKFKGKIIYVDMWATWCHPCKEELMQVKDVKTFGDFATKNNIVILYLCGDRDKKSWKGFINEHKLIGYHLFENEKLLKDLRARFSYSLTGNMTLKKGFYIPRHMIVNDKGTIVDSMADRQGSASVYAHLNKMLKQESN